MKDWMRSKIGKPWQKAKHIRPINSPLQKKKNKAERRRLRKERLEKYTKIKDERARAETLCLTYLAHFWPRFNLSKSDAEKLVLLKRAANPGWGRVSEQLRMYLRKKFEQSGFRLLNVPVEKCGCCDRPPIEKHHIVPLSHGGTNTNDNLIFICCECHNAIHPWMKADA